MTSDEIWVRVVRFAFDRQAPTNYAGYAYMCDAICEIINGDLLVGFLKPTYIAVAQKHKTSIKNIERCLRTMITRWWAHNKCGQVFTKKPTASQLLSVCSHLIRLGYHEKMLKRKLQETKKLQDTGA